MLRPILTGVAPVLAGVGLRLLVIENRMCASYVRSVAVHTSLTTRFLQKIGRKGGENSRVNLGKRLRKQLARKAAAARWGKAAP